MRCLIPTNTDPIREQYMRDNAPDRPALRALKNAAYAATREALRCGMGNLEQIDALRHMAGEIDRMVDALGGNQVIRCIQVSANGPIVQGPCDFHTRRDHYTGEIEPAGYGTINGTKGKIIAVIRNQVTSGGSSPTAPTGPGGPLAAGALSEDVK